MEPNSALVLLCIILTTYALRYRRVAMSKHLGGLAGPFCRAEARWDLGAAGDRKDISGFNKWRQESLSDIKTAKSASRDKFDVKTKISVDCVA